VTRKILDAPAPAGWRTLDTTMRQGSGLLWRTALAFLGLFVLCLALMLVIAAG
jgi:hypothetical protein